MLFFLKLYGNTQVPYLGYSSISYEKKICYVLSFWHEKLNFFNTFIGKNRGGKTCIIPKALGKNVWDKSRWRSQLVDYFIAGATTI